MAYPSINRFRRARGKVLRKLVERLARHLGRDIVVLDVGGRPDYWGNVGIGSIARIDLINVSEAELTREIPAGFPHDLFTSLIGDARSLSDFANKSVDLVHSNSVIEHVGGWDDMAAMARELRRVGLAGWVQTPAWEFPIEPHFQIPVMHWFARPMQARLMHFVRDRRHRRNDLEERWRRIERVTLLSRREVEALFPGCDIHVERLLIPKSYSVFWLPKGAGEASG
jgi:hypothetical protein